MRIVLTIYILQKRACGRYFIITGMGFMNYRRELAGLYFIITGMGFDALAKGQSLVDITYKVLMLWKRRTSKYKDRQVSLQKRACRLTFH